jgi:hypothetical protein
MGSSTAVGRRRILPKLTNAAGEFVARYMKPSDLLLGRKTFEYDDGQIRLAELSVPEKA